MINSTEFNIEKELKNKDVNMNFVQENKNNIYKYFIENAHKIREEFFKRSMISVGNKECEYVNYKGKEIGLVPSLDVVDNIIAESNFLTNIVKCCLYILEINMRHKDSLSDSVQQLQMDINNCYLQKFEEWTHFLIFVPSVYESYITLWTKHGKTDFYRNIYCYPIKNGLIESSIEDGLTFNIKNSSSKFMILQSQMIDYVYLMINMFFFLQRNGERDYRDYLVNPFTSNVDIKSYIFDIRLKFVIILFLLICVILLTIYYKDE